MPGISSNTALTSPASAHPPSSTTSVPIPDASQGPSPLPLGPSTDGPGPHPSNPPNHTRAMIGGIVGGLALLLLLLAAAALLLRRRARARRTAPSAEFMDLARGTTPALLPSSSGGSATPSGDRLLPHTSDARGEFGSDGHGNGHKHGGGGGDRDRDEERPPAFTPGDFVFTDPVLEKVHAAAMMREHYFRDDGFSKDSSSDIAPPAFAVLVHPPDGRRFSGEVDTTCTDESYGDEEEKVEYAWAI
ncbi:hypothetical protein C8Q77DRAFT_1154972 [Trametes polyzona]|nr:hypothetical protein C8Q77DRAFT_1154972 [Trametes polyzona]